jgi:anti-sigma B factor antagonist
VCSEQEALLADDWLFDARTRRPADGIVVVTVIGEVDIATVDPFRAVLAPLSTDASVRLVECDLSEVSFFGCAGVTVLLDARAEFAARGARLELAAASHAVLRTLSVTGMSDLLPAPCDGATRLGDAPH